SIAAQSTDLAGNTGAFAVSVLIGPPLEPPGGALPPADPNDAVPPSVVRVDPPNGAFIAPGDALIRVTFSEPVQRTAELSAGGIPLAVRLALGADGDPLPGRVTLAPDQRSLVFRPGTILVPD